MEARHRHRAPWRGVLRARRHLRLRVQHLRPRPPLQPAVGPARSKVRTGESQPQGAACVPPPAKTQPAQRPFSPASLPATFRPATDAAPKRRLHLPDYGFETKNSIGGSLTLRAFMLTIGLLALMSRATLAGAVETNGFIEEVARKLQSHLPKMAVDGLFEAHRGSARWTYSFYTQNREDFLANVVTIEIEQINAYRSRAMIRTARVEGGLWWRSTIRTPQQTAPWEAKILSALR